jgi:hypothetical protein
VELPNPGPDEFDSEIKGITDPFIGEGHLVIAFTELNASFHALIEAGFTENQALKFLAFCSIFEGDY